MTTTPTIQPTQFDQAPGQSRPPLGGRPAWARRAGVAGAVLALGLTAACGGSDGSDSSKASSSSSSSATASSSSSSSTPSDSGSAASGSPLTAADIGGRLSAAQKKAGSYRFTLSTAVAGQTAQGKGEADISGAKPAVSSTLSVGGGSIQTVLVDGLIYLKAPQHGTAKPWLKIDPDAKSGVGALLGQLGASADPGANLGALFKASKVTPKGSTEVGGVSARSYDVVVPREALVSALKLAPQLAKVLPAQLDYQVAVDGDDLVRKVVSTLAVQGRSATTTITFDDYGSDVHVSAPPADQVTTQAPKIGG